ncbi:MAG TPA: M48 family metallopeptidase [Oligoflexia bacterium]|nr:M48 family metallopeptidase [Oligoflexia bacterium]HMR23896.1 M48 family metallopeptidase [Oligoflexia bacterium]
MPAQKLPNEFVNFSQEHPLKGVLKMLLSLAVIMGLIFVALLLFFQWFAPSISFKTEKKWFSKSFVFSSNKNFLQHNDQYFQDLNNLVQNIARQAGFDQGDIELYIACNDLNNAFAYPGGKLIFNKGLLKTINSENELAMVIGHELGHVLHRDHLKGLGIGLSMGIVAMFIPKDLRSMVTEKMNQWLMLKHNRDQEAKADIEGVKLLYKHYGHVSGAEDFFKKMAKDEASPLNQYEKDWFSTHPSSEKRIDRLNTYILEQDWPKMKLIDYQKDHWDNLCRTSLSE